MGKHTYDLKMLNTVLQNDADAIDQLNARYAPAEAALNPDLLTEVLSNPNSTDNAIPSDSPAFRKLASSSNEFMRLFGLSAEQFQNFEQYVRPILENTQFNGEYFADAFGSRDFSAARQFLLVNDYMRNFTASASGLNTTPVTYFNNGDFDNFSLDKNPPERPGLLKRILHWMRNSLFKADFDRYETSLAEHNRLVSANTALNADSTVGNASIKDRRVGAQDLAASIKSMTSGDAPSDVSEISRSAMVSLTPEESALLDATSKENQRLMRNVTAKVLPFLSRQILEDELYFGDSRNANKSAEELDLRLNRRNAVFSNISQKSNIKINTMDRSSSRVTLARFAMLGAGYTYEQVNDTTNPSLFEARMSAGKQISNLFENGNIQELAEIVSRASQGIRNFRFDQTESRAQLFAQSVKMQPLITDYINFFQMFPSSAAKLPNSIQSAVQTLDPSLRNEFNSLTEAMTSLNVFHRFTPEVVANNPFFMSTYRDGGLTALFTTKDLSPMMNQMEIFENIMSPISGGTLGESVNSLNLSLKMQTDLLKSYATGKSVNPNTVKNSISDQIRFNSQMLNELNDVLPNPGERISVNINQNANSVVKSNQAQKANVQRLQQTRII